MSTNQNDYLCSFCSKPQAQVKRLIAGPDRVFICDECVDLCQQIISEETTEDVERLDNPLEHLDTSTKNLKNTLLVRKKLKES